MSGKKNKLIRKWAIKTDRPYRIAKKTWRKLGDTEREQVTLQMEFELDALERVRMERNESRPETKKDIP